MGRRYHFACPDCGYSAEVSGGIDCGFQRATDTIECLDCRELRDVTVGDVGSPPVRVVARCPRDARHRIQRWARNGPCPRCETPMENHGERCLWD